MILRVILLAFAATILAILDSYKLIQHYQLSGYHVSEYFKNIKKSILIKLLISSAAIFTVGLTLVLILAKFNQSYLYLSVIFYFGYTITDIILEYKNRKKLKTPLKWTYRVKRFVSIYLILSYIIYTSLLFVFVKYTSLAESILGLIPILSYLICGFAACVANPLEKLLQRKFIKAAKEKLASIPELKLIGITGSYGKTSVKHILKHLLDGEYKVCASPNSYNTPMGLCRAINENLKSEHNIFIAEMGARRKGDIAELCNIAKPDIAIITAIGEQHMATLKSINNVASTKYEIVQEKNKDGLAVFNGDNEYNIRLYNRTQQPKLISSTQDKLASVDATYTINKINSNGSSFSIKFKDGTEINCATKLLGKHNLSNITLAAMVAHYLGVSPERIAQKIETLRPIEHRLQLVDTIGDITIIDDSFNANIEGTKAALEVLKDFDGIKIIITAGLVDMGKIQQQVNTDLGRRIADVVDWCIITGCNASYIYNGLMEKNFSINKVRVVNNLDQAMRVVKGISGQKVVLFQNDLPDNY